MLPLVAIWALVWTFVGWAPVSASETARVSKAVDRLVANQQEVHESVWTLSRPPHGQYDAVALHRITKDPGGGDPARPVFLFLPGAHLHGEVVIADERYDLRLYLANRGIETWTLDYVPTRSQASRFAIRGLCSRGQPKRLSKT
jgi:hypothetical protein